MGTEKAEDEIINNATELDEQLEHENAELENEEEGEIVVSLDGESPTPEEQEEAELREKAPEWVKDLRKRQRELERENRDLKAKVTAVSGVEKLPPALGKKPQLDDDGIDYDSEKYEKALDEWYEKKREVDALESEKKTEQENQQKLWQQKLDAYGEAKSSLKVADFDDAEEVLTSTLSNTQQGIIVAGCDNPALVAYAIGKNPKKAQELSSIKDPVQFAFAIAKLEATMKVSSKKPAALPEKSVSGSGRPSGAIDKQLDRLRADAEKTGDYSKVMQYRKQQRAKG